MKPLLLLPTLLLSSLTGSIAQDSSGLHTTGPKHLVSSAAVRLYSGQIAKGWLYQVNDSQLVLLNVRKAKLKRLNDPGYDRAAKTSVTAVDQIRSISVQRKNAGLRGVLLGFAAGALTGAIMGYAEGDDPIMPNPDPLTDPFGFGGLLVGLNNAFAMKAGEKAMTYGLVLGTGGAILGAIIGTAAKKKFIIGGKKEKFHDLEGELMRRLVIR